MPSKESSQLTKSIQKAYSNEHGLKVLVINSCQKMAKGITLELMQSFTGASLTYAPTFTLAKLMLSKRKFDLVVSSSKMPDGRIQSLKEVLNSTSQPPSLVIIGEAKSKDMLGVSGYHFSSLRNLAKPDSENVVKKKVDSIKTLGADLRNDLNNPLQEIVAMAYVAKSRSASAEVTQEALEAITRAAGNLSSVVKNIEQKIRLAVAG